MRLKAFLTMAMLCLTTHVMAEKKNVTIKMLATSDVHGYFFPYDFIEHKPERIQLQETPEFTPELPAENDSLEETGEEGFLTMTLAKIYIRQQRYEKALEIMRKVNLNNPKKSVYFADQIRFLQKLIINKNHQKQ